MAEELTYVALQIEKLRTLRAIHDQFGQDKAEVLKAERALYRWADGILHPPTDLFGKAGDGICEDTATPTV